MTRTLWIVAALMLLPAVADAQQAYDKWVVKQGDTCSSIASKFYGDASLFSAIHQANDLGAPPHVLKVGSTLLLPLQPDARVQEKRGKVQVQAPQTDWRGATEGVELYRAWRVNTLDRARALVGFRDDSELLMRENTLIVIYGGSSNAAKKRGARAELTSGALRSRLSELSGVTIETPGAEATLGAGSALIAVDKAAKTRVSNHEGGATQLASKIAPDKPVAVGPGFGSAVEKGKLPTKPRPLPPAPTWKPGPRAFATLANTSVSASWEPVPKAQEYFVELAADAEGVQIMQAAYVASNVNSLEVQGLPAGTYWATVSTIDDGGFESIPAKRIELRVATFGVPPGAVAPGDSARFYAGTELRSPPGFKCAVAGAAPAELVQLRAANAPRLKGASYPGWVERVDVTCEGAQGSTVETVEVEIPAFEVVGVEDGTVMLLANATRFLDVAFATGWVGLEIAAPDTLRVDALRSGASETRMRLIAQSEFQDPGLTVSASGVPLLDLAISRPVRVIPTHIPVELGFGGIGFLAPAGLPGRERADGGLGGRLFAAAEVAPWFTAGASLDLLALVSSASFAPAFGVDARIMIPASVRPYLGVGTRVWVPVDGDAFATLEPALGFDIPFASWGLDARFMGSIFSNDGRARASAGLMFGAYRAF